MATQRKKAAEYTLLQQFVQEKCVVDQDYSGVGFTSRREAQSAGCGRQAGYSQWDRGV